MIARNSTDRAALCFLLMAMGYLLTGILFGVAGSLQYVLPAFLKEQLSFQKSRPLHVYLVISWIFTAAQGIIYFVIPRIAGRAIRYPGLVWFHLVSQFAISSGVVIAFCNGNFGGREYLEFPPFFGLLIIISWFPFAVNFFATLKPVYRKAPVYIWSWSAGILFFFITMAESYLWMVPYFRDNIIRDITVQWKALGSMVGSWNMLVYGSAMYIMERLSGDKQMAKSPVAFLLFFLGLTNLMFNWGHHTYTVPAAPWVKTVAYTISMTELLIFGHIIFKWRKTMTNAAKNFHRIPYRTFSFADVWIFLNLGVAIAISVPALNYFTHGTHITVAHAMGATIGINTMLLFGCIFFVIKKMNPEGFQKRKRWIGFGLALTNISLVFFWTSLIGSGLIKISARINHTAFYKMMQASKPFFKVFASSGFFILAGIIIMIISVFKCIRIGTALNRRPGFILQEKTSLPENTVS